MTELKRGEQHGGKHSTGQNPRPREGNEEENEGGEFGTSERATRGTDRDFDESGESANQGHGHPREERNRRGPQ